MLQYVKGQYYKICENENLQILFQVHKDYHLLVRVVCLVCS